MGLYKRGTVWWCRFKVRGEIIRQSTGTADRAAAQVEEARLRIKHVDDPNIGHRQRCRLTELEAADIARAKLANVTEAQTAGLEYLWDGLVSYFGEDRDPATISYDDLEAYAAHRMAKVSGETARRELQCLKRGFRIAARRGWITHAPADWPRLRSGPRNKAQAGKWHPLEVVREWLAAMAEPARVHAIAVLFTGMRKTEAQRAELSWLEEPPPGLGCAAILRIPAEAAKDRDERIVPLSAEALVAVKTYLATPAAKRPGSHFRSRNTARLKIGYLQEITLRDLRHTFATLADRSGDRKAAQDLLGHTTERMTGRYLHSDLDRITATSAATAAAIGRAITALRAHSPAPGGHSAGGTISASRAECAATPGKPGGRRRDRTADILRVSPAPAPDFSNLRSLSDNDDHGETTSSKGEVPQAGAQPPAPRLSGRKARR